MKALEDLSKEELISFISNYKAGDVNVLDSLAECVSCGTDPRGKYWYVCDVCAGTNKSKTLKEKFKWRYAQLKK